MGGLLCDGVGGGLSACLDVGGLGMARSGGGTARGFSMTHL